jgi:hypothetical protein
MSKYGNLKLCIGDIGVVVLSLVEVDDEEAELLIGELLKNINE